MNSFSGYEPFFRQTLWNCLLKLQKISPKYRDLLYEDMVHHVCLILKRPMTDCSYGCKSAPVEKPTFETDKLDRSVCLILGCICLILTIVYGSTFGLPILLALIIFGTFFVSVPLVCYFKMLTWWFKKRRWIKEHKGK